MFYVYILYSSKGNKYYVGQTSDIELRLKFHNELSDKSYTSKYRPWALKRVIEVNSRSEAIKIERKIKNRKSRKYIEKLIVDNEVVTKLLKSLLPQ